jgi:peptide/nickel transport system substrate-binding protein
MQQQQQQSKHDEPLIPDTPITRRQALQRFALVTGGGVMAVNLLAACNDAPTTGTQKTAASIVPTPRNQTVIIDQADFTVYDSFNPFTPNGQQYNAGLYQVCEEFLFYFNMVTGEITPWLAKSWAYNKDYTQLTLNLNPSAKWNDGQPFTSKDILFTVNLLMKNSQLSGANSYIPFVKGITTPDAQTIVFALNASNPRFHYNFICGIVGGQDIVAEHIWSGKDPLTIKDNPPVRTGPYKLDRVIPAQKMYIWKKDPNYWNKDAFDPKPEYIVYRTGPTVDSEVEEFQRGQIDVPGNFDLPHATAIKNAGYKNIIIESQFRDPCPRGFLVNSDPSKGLLSDPRMHWAISYLVDRKTLALSTWLMPTVPAQYPWADYPGNDKWSNSEIAAKYQLTYDPKKAGALLDEMGAKAGSDGKRTYQGKPLQYEIITSQTPGNPEYLNGQKLATELNNIGIGATVRYYEGSAYSDKVSNGQFDIITGWICGNTFDPGQLYTDFEIRKYVPVGQLANNNQMRIHYQALSDLAVKIDNVDPGSSGAKALFDQTLEAFYQDLPEIPIYQTTYPTFYNTTYWTGWPTNENLYQVPSNWWGQFMFIIGKLQPTGQS